MCLPRLWEKTPEALSRTTGWRSADQSSFLERAPSPVARSKKLREKEQNQTNMQSGPTSCRFKGSVEALGKQNGSAGSWVFIGHIRSWRAVLET